MSEEREQTALVRFVTAWMHAEARRQGTGRFEATPRSLGRMGLTHLEAEYVLRAAVHISDQITACPRVECLECRRLTNAGTECPYCFCDVPDVEDYEDEDDIEWVFVARVPKPEHHAAHVALDAVQQRLEHLGVTCREELDAVRSRLAEKEESS